jgi:hypothetical protein
MPLIRNIFSPSWVRKLIGKLGVPYNRRLRVRDSSHPSAHATLFCPFAAESRASRIQVDFTSLDRLIAASMTLLSSWETRVCMSIPRSLVFGTFGLPIFGFIKILSV